MDSLVAVTRLARGLAGRVRVPVAITLAECHGGTSGPGDGNYTLSAMQEQRAP